MEIFNIFVDGGSGTTGLTISQSLSRLNYVDQLTISAEDHKNIDKRLEKIRQADLSILCLPDEAAEEIADRIPKDCRIIDTSTAHRTDPAWVYGMAELEPGQREKIRRSNRVANPGCHATGFILAVRPLIVNKIIPADYPLVATSITGYSGGGKAMINNYDGDAAQINRQLRSPAHYALGQNHKHLAEMMAMTGVTLAPSFQPIVADYYRGMYVTIPLQEKYMGKKLGLRELTDLYRSYYEGCAGRDNRAGDGSHSDQNLISVRLAAEDEKFIYSDKLAGSDKVEIIIYGNDQRPVIGVRFDNLGKGACGAAIQNMNIMLGFGEA